LKYTKYIENKEDFISYDLYSFNKFIFNEVDPTDAFISLFTTSKNNINDLPVILTIELTDVVFKHYINEV